MNQFLDHLKPFAIEIDGYLTYLLDKKIFHEKTRHAIQKKSTEYAIYLILKELKKI